MLFTTAFVSTILFSATAFAQQGGNGNPQNGQNGQTPQGMVNVHVVQVSNAEGSKKFYPETLKANPGEMVQFQFHPKNHSVVQADFSEPCTPISDVKSDVVGVKSGFMPVAADANQMPVFTMMVNSTDPMWIYCGAEGHCQGGMVMAINAAATGEKTLASYKAAAAKAVSGAVPSGAPDGSAGTGTTGTNAGNGGSGSADSSGAASGSPTGSGAPTSTGGASSMQTMSGAGLAGLFIACAAFIGL